VLTVPSPATPRRLEPDLAVSEHGTLDAPRLDELSRSPAFVAALLVLWRCLHPAVLPGCRIGGRLRNWPRHLRRTAPTPHPRCVARSPAHRPTRWRLALCRGGPGLRRRSQRRRLRPRELRHCACVRERHGDHRAHPDPPSASCWVSDICRTEFPPHPGPPHKRGRPPSTDSPLSQSTPPAPLPSRSRARLGPSPDSQGSPAEPTGSAAAQRSERRFTLRLMVDGTAHFTRPLVLQDCDHPASAEALQSSHDAQATKPVVSLESREQREGAGDSNASRHDAGARRGALFCSSSPSSSTHDKPASHHAGPLAA
jgi:hypothetical protein